MLLPAATAGREPSANALAISATSNACMGGSVFNGAIPWCVTSVTPGETQLKLGQQPSVRGKPVTPTVRRFTRGVTMPCRGAGELPLRELPEPFVGHACDRPRARAGYPA
jgi:hypothetical protein